jgi:outer membrane protein W
MRYITILLTALLLAAASSVYAQTKINLVLYGGYSMPVGDIKGDFPDTLGTALLDFDKSSTLLTSSGYNFGATGKYSVDTLGKARVTAGFNYNSFSGSKDYPRSGATLTYKNKVNIFTISLGAEYGFFPKKKFNPFVGLDLAMNFFSGKIEASGDSAFTIQRKSESRFGIVVNGGVDIKLNKNFGAVVGVKYGLTNLIGKKTDITTTATLQTDDEETGNSTIKELGLNDEESSNNKSKTLYYVQFYAGVSLYLGEVLK